MTSARETRDPLTATADCQQAIVGAVEFTYVLPYALLSADHSEERDRRGGRGPPLSLLLDLPIWVPSSIG